LLWQNNLRHPSLRFRPIKSRQWSVRVGDHYRAVGHFVEPDTFLWTWIGTHEDYEELVELLDRVTDRVGENEDHPLASLMDVLGVLIEKYEDEHVPELTE